MNNIDKKYYQEMLRKHRLIPIIKNKKLICVITFYITNDESLYIKSDPWEVLQDEDNGKICYVSQIISDKNYDNHKLSITVWRHFKVYIKNNFPSVKVISWRRWNWNTEKIRVYKKEI